MKIEKSENGTGNGKVGIINSVEFRIEIEKSGRRNQKQCEWKLE